MNRGLVALLAVVGLAACRPRADAQRRGPFLSILRQDAATPARRSVSPASIALALGGLPPEALTRLREYLAQSTDAAVRRAAPQLFDLGLDGDAAAAAPDPLRQALPDVPAWTAAANVLGAPWSAPGLSVELGPSCASDAARCVPLFATTAAGDDDAVVRRGRALAWSLGNATLLRVPAGSRAAVLRSLRRAQAAPSSAIALVFGAPRGTLDEAELEPLRDQARTALAHLPPGSPQRAWLDALTAARASWELPIAFDADQVLVVPRLGALARLQAFQAEVTLAARRSDGDG
jgi:hypothetical protein